MISRRLGSTGAVSLLFEEVLAAVGRGDGCEAVDAGEAGGEGERYRFCNGGNFKSSSPSLNNGYSESDFGNVVEPDEDDNFLGSSGGNVRLLSTMTEPVPGIDLSGMIVRIDFWL